MQVGRVDGDLSTDHSTHHHTTRLAQSGCVGTGAMHMGAVQNVTQVHQHFYAAVEPEHAVRPSAAPPAARPAATAAQKEVLALLRPLPESVRSKVWAFMRREFQTAMVVDLQPHQLYRVRRYVETVNQSACELPTRHNDRRQQ